MNCGTEFYNSDECGALAQWELVSGWERGQMAFASN